MAITWRMEVIEYAGGDITEGGKEVARHFDYLPTPPNLSALDYAGQFAETWPADSRASSDADTWVVRVRALDGSLGTARGNRGSGPAQRLGLTRAFTFAAQADALDPIVALLARLRERISPEDPTVPGVSRLVPQLADLASAVEQALRDTGNSRFSEAAHSAQHLRRLSEQITATAADVAAYR